MPPARGTRLRPDLLSPMAARQHDSACPVGGGKAVALRLSVPGVSQLFEVVPAAGLLPDRVALLASRAEQEGIRIVSTLRERWEDESERYGGHGEAVLAAVARGEVVGVGGLSHCPHVDGALRMRRFYVAPAWRRRGVARSLAQELITTGHVYADVITCNARASVAAAPFWESVGFIPVDVEGITHVHRS